MSRIGCTRLAFIVTLVFFTLLWISSYTVVLGSCRYHRNRGALYQSRNDVTLDHHRLCIIGGVVRPTRCYVLCSVRVPRCKSFNYDSRKRQCELNDATMEEFPADVRELSEVKYFGLMVSWTKSWSGRGGWFGCGVEGAINGYVTSCAINSPPPFFNLFFKTKDCPFSIHHQNIPFFNLMTPNVMILSLKDPFFQNLGQFWNTKMHFDFVLRDLLFQLATNSVLKYTWAG